MRSIFFSVPRDFPYFIVILGEKRGIRADGPSDARATAYLRRSQSLVSSSVCKLYKLCSTGVAKDQPIAVDRYFGRTVSVKSLSRNIRILAESDRIISVSVIFSRVCIVSLNKCLINICIYRVLSHDVCPVGPSHVAMVNPPCSFALWDRLMNRRVQIQLDTNLADVLSRAHWHVQLVYAEMISYMRLEELSVIGIYILNNARRLVSTKNKCLVSGKRSRRVALAIVISDQSREYG